MGNPVVYFEIGSKDSTRSTEFYAGLFDWKIERQGPAAAISTGGPGGIPGHIVDLAAEWGRYITVYVEVDDLQAYLDKAQSLGGKILLPPVPIPGQGSFAWLADPDGNIVGIWKTETPGG